MRIIFFVLSVLIANTITAQGLFNTIVKEVTKIELTEEEVHFKFLLQDSCKWYSDETRKLSKITGIKPIMPEYDLPDYLRKIESDRSKVKHWKKYIKEAKETDLLGQYRQDYQTQLNFKSAAHEVVNINANTLDSLKQLKQQVMFMAGYHSGDKITNPAVKSRLDAIDAQIAQATKKSQSSGELIFENTNKPVSEALPFDIDLVRYYGYYPLTLHNSIITSIATEIKYPNSQKIEDAFNESIKGLKVFDINSKTYKYLSSLTTGYDDAGLSQNRSRVNFNTCIPVKWVEYLKNKYVGKEVNLASTVGRVYLEDQDTLTWHTIDRVSVGEDDKVYLISNDGTKFNMNELIEIDHPLKSIADEHKFFLSNHYESIVTKDKRNLAIYRSKQREKEEAEALVQLVKAASDPRTWAAMNDINGMMREQLGLSKKIGDHYIYVGMTLTGFRHSYPNAKLISAGSDFGIPKSVYALNNLTLIFSNNECISIE